MTAAELAALSARAYRHMHPWTEADFAEALNRPETLLVAVDGAFALGRVVLDEAEILALATDPDRQRSGQGSAALAQFETRAAARGAARILLEVAAPNAPACAFYQARGYTQAGRRKSYYASPEGGRADALLMTKALA